MLNKRTKRDLNKITRISISTVLFLALWPTHFTHAAVFLKGVKWPTNSNGLTIIPICFNSGESSTDQKSGGGYKSFIYDSPPSPGELVTGIRRRLAATWESYSNVRFSDWSLCSPSNASTAVGFYIHPDATNASYPGTWGRGQAKSTHIKPFGDGSQPYCIYYNSDSTHMTYKNDCAVQYGNHEFGHVLGFEHEIYHPNVPTNCLTSNPGSDFTQAYITGQTQTASFISTATSGSVVSTSYPGNTNTDFIVANSSFDAGSVMTYGGKCVNQSGVRFGNMFLDFNDITGLAAVYPQVGTPLVLAGQTYLALNANTARSTLGWATGSPQLYTYVPVPNGSTGKIMLANGSGTCLTLFPSSGNGKQGDPVGLAACDGSASKQWVANGAGEFRNPLSNLCLDANGNNNSFGNNVTVYSCNGGSNQQFIFRTPPSSSAPLAIANLPGSCIYPVGPTPAKGANYPDGTLLVISLCTGGSQLLFTYVPSTQQLKSGTSSSPMCVTMVASNSQLKINTCTANNTNQQWILNEATNTISSVANGQCIDVAGSNTSSGTPVVSYGCNGNWNQQWSWPSY